MLWEQQNKQKQANQSYSWVAMENKEFTSSKKFKYYGHDFYMTPFRGFKFCRFLW